MMNASGEPEPLQSPDDRATVSKRALFDHLFHGQQWLRGDTPATHQQARQQVCVCIGAFGTVSVLTHIFNIYIHTHTAACLHAKRESQHNSSTQGLHEAYHIKQAPIFTYVVLRKLT
jgi:hypothetical protein